jgi:hypothetical protein
VAMGKQKSKITCSSCGKDKDNTQYYGSQSPFHKFTGKVTVCKDCFWEFVGEDVDRLKIALRMIDRPFLIELYESSLQEAEKTNKSALGMYMKNSSMPQYRGLNWDDSDFEGHKSSKEIHSEKVDVEELLKTELLDEDILTLRKKWGKFETEDYVYLESFYNEYAHSYATDTPVQINLYKNIAKVHLQAEKELSEGDTRTFKDLMELSSKLHNDGNIKPIQSTGANDDKGLSTYGLWIKTIEQDEPCEHFESKPTYEDYDKFQKYIDKWFIRPFKNIFNISKDFDVRDDDK